MGIVAYYSKHHKEGKIACLRAIENGTKLKINTDIDKNNLNFYLADENKNISESKNTADEETTNVNKILTKNQFIQEKISELKKLYPKSTEKHLLQVAKSQWKNKIAK
jgi:K+/H+ antiporter YhaU regulatory subunit KhtT